MSGCTHVAPRDVFDLIKAMNAGDLAEVHRVGAILGPEGVVLAPLRLALAIVEATCSDLTTAHTLELHPVAGRQPQDPSMIGFGEMLSALVVARDLPQAQRLIREAPPEWRSDWIAMSCLVLTRALLGEGWRPFAVPDTLPDGWTL